MLTLSAVGRSVRVAGASFASFVLFASFAREARAQGVLTVPPPQPPVSTTSAVSPPPSPAPVVAAPSSSRAFLPLDPGVGGTWVTMPALEADGRVEAFVGSAKEDQDDPEDDDAAWRTICHEPCGVWVRPGTRLRVNGALRVSPAFTLPAQPRVHLAVDPGRRSTRKAGIIVMSTGVAAPVAVGTFFAFYVMFAAQGFNKTAAEEAQFERDTKRITNVLVGSAIAGGVGLGVGLTLLLTNVRTTVTPTTPTGGFARLSSPPRVRVAEGLWLTANGLSF